MPLSFIGFFLMIRRPPRSTRTDTLFPTRRSSDLQKQRLADEDNDYRYQYSGYDREEAGAAEQSAQAFGIGTGAHLDQFGEDRLGKQARDLGQRSAQLVGEAIEARTCRADEAPHQQNGEGAG